MINFFLIIIFVLLMKRLNQEKFAKLVMLILLNKERYIGWVKFSLANILILLFRYIYLWNHHVLNKCLNPCIYVFYCPKFDFKCRSLRSLVFKICSFCYMLILFNKRRPIKALLGNIPFFTVLSRIVPENGARMG